MSVQTGPVPVRRRIDPGRHDDMTIPTSGTTAMPRQSRQSAGATSEAERFRPAWLVVLVPAYQPDARLAALVTDIRRRLPGAQVLVVDDGSGPAYEEVFAAAGDAGAVITHRLFGQCG